MVYNEIEVMIAMTYQPVTNRELLELAHDHGYQMSPPQLARWHRDGLLPQPKQRPLGKAKGTESVYPPGTAEQLLALLEIHNVNRRMTDVAWKLWWAGYSVDMEIIRKRLREVASKLIELQDQVLSEDGLGLSSVALNWIDDSAKTRLPKPLADARQRVKPENFPNIAEILFEVLSGTFTGFQLNPNTQSMERSVEDFESALGLKRARTDSLSTTAPWLGGSPNEVEGFIRDLSSWLGQRPWYDLIETSSDDDLNRSRDDVRAFFGLFSGFMAFAEEAFGRNAFGMVALAKAGRALDDDVTGQAFFVLGLRMFANHTHLLEGIEAYRQTAREWEEQHQPALQVLEALVKEFPEHKDLLEVKNVMRAQKSPQKADALTKLLGEFYSSHADELEDFFAKHPEFSQDSSLGDTVSEG